MIDAKKVLKISFGEGKNEKLRKRSGNNIRKLFVYFEKKNIRKTEEKKK